jgi:hypothetical protein
VIALPPLFVYPLRLTVFILTVDKRQRTNKMLNMTDGKISGMVSIFRRIEKLNGGVDYDLMAIFRSVPDALDFIKGEFRVVGPRTLGVSCGGVFFVVGKHTDEGALYHALIDAMDRVLADHDNTMGWIPENELMGTDVDDTDVDGTDVGEWLVVSEVGGVWNADSSQKAHVLALGLRACYGGMVAVQRGDVTVSLSSNKDMDRCLKKEAIKPFDTPDGIPY